MYYASVDEDKVRSAQTLRNHRVDHQHAEQRSRKLNDSAQSQLLSRLGEDVSALQIRLVEYLSDLALNGNDFAPVYEQTLIKEPLLIDSAQNGVNASRLVVHILRLDVQLQLSHGREFIQLVKGINSEIGGWPFEVRACDLQRIPLNALNIRCVFDIYHWSTDVD